jgi:hypothetical protein
MSKPKVLRHLRWAHMQGVAARTFPLATPARSRADSRMPGSVLGNGSRYSFARWLGSNSGARGRGRALLSVGTELTLFD